MTDHDRKPSSATENAADALAELIRRAGRRPTPRTEDFERVRLASHLAWQMKVHAVRRRRAMWYALAASVMAAAVGLLALLQGTPPLAVAEMTVARGRVEQLAPRSERWETLAPAQAISAGTRLRTADDGGAAFELADGTILRVSGSTSLVFASAERLALDAGTIYVDTGPAVRPGGVEISTARGTVHDIGTQFEVRAYSSELRLRVREGRVQVVTAVTTIPYETPAGEELLLAADGAVARSSIATDGDEWRWAQALATSVDLDGGTAFEALQWVARETGKRLIFADVNTEILARKAVFHGSSVGLEPLQILEVVMATSAELDYALGEGTLVIRRR